MYLVNGEGHGQTRVWASWGLLKDTTHPSLRRATRKPLTAPPLSILCPHRNESGRHAAKLEILKCEQQPPGGAGSREKSWGGAGSLCGTLIPPPPLWRLELGGEGCFCLTPQIKNRVGEAHRLAWRDRQGQQGCLVQEKAGGKAGHSGFSWELHTWQELGRREGRGNRCK